MEQNKTIAIGQQVRPIHFGFTALAEWCDLTGSKLNDLSSLGKNLSLTAAIQLVYCGLKHGARVNNQEIDFTWEKVGDWIDDEGMDVFNQAMEIFTESLAKITPEKKKKGRK